MLTFNFKYSPFSAICEYTYVNIYQMKNKDISLLIISEEFLSHFILIYSGLKYCKII